ncbi:MAG: nucleotidyltransferase domain-containing protein [Candidatus Bathyarchaeota archaeon]|nr:MAG: nucleotidyltransferase domain-containing protein [Candidatus Bathyarchaeota archaeon]
MDKIEVVYTPTHWQLLNHFRKKAELIMKTLTDRNMDSAVYGSVARGDVNNNSDVDIIIPYIVSSHTVELALTFSRFKIYSRKIAQATPNHTPKAHIYLDISEKLCVTFPLVPFRSLEYEFYKFGGLLGIDKLRKKERVPGCDKKLMLIEPTSKGHIESPIHGRAAEVAQIIGVNIDIIKERTRVLNRRKKIGRTGIITSVNLHNGEVFEEVLKNIADSNPIVRRRIMNR